MPQRKAAKFVTGLLLLLTATFTSSAPESALTLKQAIEKVQQMHPGEVVKSEAVTLDNKRVYKIRLVSSGHVRDIILDSETGELIQPEKE